MTDHVETMAYAHEVPWHGKGFKVDDNLTPAEMCAAARCDWRVEKRPVFTCYADGDDHVRCDEIRGRYALTRDKDGRVFDIVSDRFRPVQNEDLFETFKRFCQDGGATMETAGALHDGKVVWALANLHQNFTLPGGEAVKGFMLLATRHAVGYPTIGRLTPICVVCANTFAMSGGFKGAAQLRVPHTQDFDPAWAADQFNLVRAGLSEFETNAQLLQKLNIGRSDALRLLQPIYQPDIENVRDLIDNYDEKANRTVKGIMEAAIKGAGQDARGENNGWALFNGASYWANHRARGGVDRMASTFMGSNSDNLNKLFASLVEMAD